MPTRTTLFIIKRTTSAFATLCLAALLAQPAAAQYATTPPVQDGTITAGEYGGSSFNCNTGTWYMAWDDTKLYMAKTNGQTGEPVYVYLDIDPLVPVNGGGNANGNLTGTNDFSTTPSLPMRADVRIYWTSNYIEYKLRDGNGAWGPAITTATNISQSNSGTNREMFLRWDALPGLTTRPMAFNWLGYQSYGTNPYLIYDYTPGTTRVTDNSTGSNPYYAYYNTVSNTSATGTTNPFAQQSYTFPMSSINDNFGAISVYDFTMNSQRISRSANGGDWNIAGTLVVGAGALYFGDQNTTTFGATNVGNVQVTGGLLDMDYANRPMNVAKNVNLTGGTLKLSAIGSSNANASGNLIVGGNFTVNGGMFNPFNRQVTFNGAGAQVLSNVPNGTAGLVFDYLTFNNATGPLTMGSNITVRRDAVFTSGVLATGANTVLLDQANSTLTETNTSYINGLTQTSATLGSGGASTNNFHGIGLTITSQRTSAAPGNTTLLRTTGTTLTGENSNQSISRYFTLTPANTTGLDLQLDFRYLDNELNTTQFASKNTLTLYASSTAGMPFQAQGGTNISNITTNTVTTDPVYNFPTASRVFTLSNSANPLPVKLVSFEAQAVGNDVRLSWRTAQEVNSLGFGVERQAASGAWEELALVESHSPNGGSYTYLDIRPAAKASPYRYYRLRQIDHDGSSAYSPVAAAKLATSAGLPVIQLSPVPADNVLTVSTGADSAAEIRIFDLQGKLLYRAQAPAGRAAVPVAGLAGGVYIIEVRAAGGSQRLRFVKE